MPIGVRMFAVTEYALVGIRFGPTVATNDLIYGRKGCWELRAGSVDTEYSRYERPFPKSIEYPQVTRQPSKAIKEG